MSPGGLLIGQKRRVLEIVDDFAITIQKRNTSVNKKSEELQKKNLALKIS
jgi:hypothetical protein